MPSLFSPLSALDKGHLEAGWIFFDALERATRNDPHGSLWSFAVENKNAVSYELGLRGQHEGR